MPRWDEWEKTDTSKASGAQPSKKGPSAAGEVVKFAISPSLYFVEKMYRWAKKDKSSPPSPEPLRDVAVGGSVPVTVVSERPAPRTPDITCGTITIDNLDFPDWFDREFHNKDKKRFRNSLVKRREPGGVIVDCKANFHAVWDQVERIAGKKSVGLPEFVAHLMIMYNETGGTLLPKVEQGDAAYFFEYRPLRDGDRKATYNGSKRNKRGEPIGNRFAGDQLKERKIISDDADVELWNRGDLSNGPSPIAVKENYGFYPKDQPESVRRAARECDFYKFRGRGLLQLTHWKTYQAALNPTIGELYDGRTVDDLSSAELDDAIRDPRVYAAAFREFIRTAKPTCAQALKQVIEKENFIPYGNAVAGGKQYGPDVFQPRCEAVLKAMKGIGYKVG